MLNRQQCIASNPCSGLSGTDNGCLSNLKSGQVGKNKYTLLAEAGVALEKMYNDMPEDVKNDLVISDSYRPLKTQCNIFDFDKFEATGKRIKKGTSGTPVARPGTSNHGWGRALDLSKKKAQDWIRENGSKYGWCWGEVKSEPWHFTFCGPGPNKSDLCNSICKGAIDPSISSGSASSSTSTPTSGSTETKKSPKNMMDMLTGDLTSWMDTFMPMKEEVTEQPINEEIDRIKDLIKKVL